MAPLTLGNITTGQAASKWYEGICSHCRTAVTGSAPVKPAHCPNCRELWQELKIPAEPVSAFDVAWIVSEVRGGLPGVRRLDKVFFQGSETDVAVLKESAGIVARLSPATSFEVMRCGADRGAGSWHLVHRGKLLAIISPSIPQLPISEEEAHPAVVVWSYGGRTQADAAVDFARHASELAADGYAPTSQSWAEGRPGIGRVLALGTLGAMAIKPKGFLSVTYQRRTDASGSEAHEPTGSTKLADPIDQIRRLGDLRDAGLITDEEYLAKKTEMLGRL